MAANKQQQVFVLNALRNAFLFVICVASLFPFYWLVKSSLMDDLELFRFPPKYYMDSFRWENFAEVFRAVPFHLYFQNTMMIIIPVLIGTLVTCSLGGYAFARLNFPLKNMWFILVMSSLMLPPAVTLIPKYIVWSHLGAINTFYPLIIPAWLGGGAFNIFLIRQFFMGISKELDESATIDGAGYFRVFYDIMLPLITPVLVVIAFFTFIHEWNDFFQPLLYLNNDSKFTLALGLITLRGEFSTKWNLLMAGSAIMTLPAVIIFFFGQKYFVEGISFTGIKG
ncbi:carbohydrate ABC transporter permease [Paenibacillus agricola]|uniref:Carbohydrate ABC transporter permease n=1 Tax=Paenibacillus agricola TaxID=2716264 RepID=A0ABX0J8H4_9BACL|nr:carbohydrate ABC transporter permease [Paenibacillus agricola]NHN32669.1 carbohydrate ABC transporter permease [Paenibacillus agricola]